METFLTSVLWLAWDCCPLYFSALLPTANLYCVLFILTHYGLVIYINIMLTQWHWNALCIIGSLWVKSTSDCWILFTKGQSCGALSSCWTNNLGAGDLRCHDAHIILYHQNMVTIDSDDCLWSCQHQTITWASCVISSLRFKETNIFVQF